MKDKTNLFQNTLRISEATAGLYFIQTYGCQMNDYDSQKMESIMQGFNLAKTAALEEADFILINTCHIREKATEKLYSQIGRIKDQKKLGAKLIVAGCVAQAEGEEVMKRAKVVDLIVGPQSIHRLEILIPKMMNGEQYDAVNLDFRQDKFDILPETFKTNKISANLTIQEGCDEFCKFCCVPYTRGPEYSRPLGDIYREAQALIGRGAREITVLGQNVSAYHGQSPNGDYELGELLVHLAAIPHLQRLRYTTSHPRDFLTYKKIFEAHKTLEILMPFVHLPVQSGSDKILKCMNRKHTREEYFTVINDLRATRPDIQFSTDIIVGYPGETEEDFEDTLELSQKVGYSQGFLFKFSPRPGTPAALNKNIVPKNIVDQRFQRLKTLFDEMQANFNRACVDQSFPVLFEGLNQLGQIYGRTPYLQLVNMPVGSLDLVGQVKNVKITKAFGHSLLGELVEVMDFAEYSAA